MKLFRRVSALALVLALVCAFSATVFAIESYYLTEDYGSGSEMSVVEVSANIQKTSTSGYIQLYALDTADNPLTITTSYRWYQTKGGNAKTDYKSETTTSTADVSFSDATMYHMVDATYTFYAQVPTPYGAQIFDHDPVYLEYEV